MTLSSMYIPFITKLTILPALYYPVTGDGSGFENWVPPSSVKLGVMNALINLLLIIAVGTVTGTMSTAGACNRRRVKQSLYHTIFPVAAFFGTRILLHFVPLVKAPVIAALSFLPYAGMITDALFTGFFTLFIGALGNAKLRRDVCNE